MQPLKDAIADIWSGFRMRRVWMALAQEDIGDQYRRTRIGPIWLLINYLAYAGTFIFVFQRGATDQIDYITYVAVSLFVWFFIMETITQSVSLFIREESFIKGTTLPLTVYVMRLAMQSSIRAAYALAGCLMILTFSASTLSIGWLWSLVGIVVVLAVMPAAITLIAFIGAYFPDSQFIVSNMMRIGMFLTPVFWTYEGSGGIRHLFYHWNPFTYFLEIVRVPILTGTMPVNALLFCVTSGMLLWAAALFILGRYRRDVVFVI